MKKLKLMMMMTLMMCLVGMTSYSQVNETDIFVNKQEVKTINFKLEKSSAINLFLFMVYINLIK